MKKFTTLLIVLSNAIVAYGQVGVNTNTPKATLDIQNGIIVNNPDGLLIPRLSVTDVEAKNAAYGADQNGTLIYVTSLSSGQTTKTSEILNPGFYYYDDATSKWKALGGYAGNEPVAIWVRNAAGQRAELAVKSSGEGRTAGTEFVATDAGNVGIGIPTPNSNAMLDISSSNKGILIPRLTTTERNNIPATLANGLMIYNITENCLNYYNAGVSQWLSLCGTFSPAKYDLVSCSVSPSGPLGTYRQGTALNEQTNTYTVSVNVTQAGSYDILASTTNGYSFYKSGTFTQTGTYNVVLAGQGTPANGPQSDTVTLSFNGISVASSCTPVSVAGNTTMIIMNCAGRTVNGTYLKGQAVNSTHYVDIPVTAVTTPGSVNITTNTANGLTFSSGAVNVTAGTTSIRLFAQGTPTNTDNGTLNTYTFTVPTNNGTCSFGVNVGSTLGTFGNPAESCQKIYDEFNSSGTLVANDGDYWIGTSTANRYKTRCDMVDAAEAASLDKEVGGYTLLWTTSEKTTDDNGWWSNSGNMSLQSGWGRNVVTTEAGAVNINDFRINTSERSRWSGKKTRLVVTNEPANHNVSNDTYFNVPVTNIITGENWRGAPYQGVTIMQGKYMGTATTVTKNASGDRSTIVVGGQTIISNAYHFGNTIYPFHFDLTNYGYFPAGLLTTAGAGNVHDGNWPFWVAGEYEGMAGQEPFGACNVVSDTSSVGRFWGNASTTPNASVQRCIYNNANVSVTTGINGVNGKVMQWWAK